MLENITEYGGFQPLDHFRWVTRDQLQQKYACQIGPDYVGERRSENDAPVWTQDETLKGRLWKPRRAEWRDVERMILQ